MTSTLLGWIARLGPLCLELVVVLAATLGGCCHPEPQTPLARAAASDDAAAVRALAAAGAPLEEQDALGHTALLWACRHGATGAALALLDLGADVDGPDGRPDFAWTPLITAIHTGHAGTARALLARGADVNARGRNGVSPLLTAIADVPSAEERTPLVRELLAAGADPRAELTSGMNALGLAAAVGDEELLRLIHGAAPDLRLPDTLLGTVAHVVGRLRGNGAVLDGIEQEASAAR
jgi:ankyrin repeat protein